jgi:hypothetical protein
LADVLADTKTGGMKMLLLLLLLLLLRLCQVE